MKEETKAKFKELRKIIDDIQCGQPEDAEIWEEDVWKAIGNLNEALFNIGI